MPSQACDITHGGLSLSESPKWLEAKKEIESDGIRVVQWHRDEIAGSLKDYIKSTNLRYPAVVLDTGDASYRNIMTNQDLNACGGDPMALVEELQKKDVLLSKETGSSSL